MPPRSTRKTVIDPASQTPWGFPMSTTFWQCFKWHSREREILLMFLLLFVRLLLLNSCLECGACWSYCYSYAIIIISFSFCCYWYKTRHCGYLWRHYVREAVVPLGRHCFNRTTASVTNVFTSTVSIILYIHTPIAAKSDPVTVNYCFWLNITQPQRSGGFSRSNQSSTTLLHILPPTSYFASTTHPLTSNSASTTIAPQLPVFSGGWRRHEPSMVFQLAKANRYEIIKLREYHGGSSRYNVTFSLNRERKRERDR